MENLADFCNNVEKFLNSSSLITVSNVMKCRARTTGILECSIKLKNTTITIMNVGGQRPERKKWIHCFEGVSILLYFVSLS